MRPLVALALVLLLAGCAGSPDGTGDPAGGTPDGTGETTEDSTRVSQSGEGKTSNTTAWSRFDFDQTFPLRVITGAGGSTGAGDNGGNCVIFPTGLRIGKGSATVTWSTPVPTDLSLDVAVENGSQRAEPVHQVGGTPLTATFEYLPEGHTTGSLDWGTFFMVHAGTLPEAVADVEMHIAFAYEAVSPVEVEATDAACG